MNRFAPGVLKKYIPGKKVEKCDNQYYVGDEIYC